MKIVANPKKQKKPNTSVKVVTKIEEAIAGSIPKTRSNNGIEVPITAAIVKFACKAINITIERIKFPVKNKRLDPQQFPP